MSGFYLVILDTFNTIQRSITNQKYPVMNNLKSQNILEEADEMLQTAKEELCRPEEDVVHYMVCKHAYKAITKFMAGYLISQGQAVSHSSSISDLLEKCRNINPTFQKLNLDPLLRQGNPEDLWMNTHTAKEFIDLASKTRNMVGFG